MTGSSHGRFRLSKKQRLRKRPEYLACYTRGKRYFSKRFILFALPRAMDGQGARLGTAVSRKIGKSVRRNRLKRLLREFFRLHQEEMDRDVDLVIVPKKGIDVRSIRYSDLEEDLGPAVRRIMNDLARNNRE